MFKGTSKVVQKSTVFQKSFNGHGCTIRNLRELMCGTTTARFESKLQTKEFRRKSIIFGRNRYAFIRAPSSSRLPSQSSLYPPFPSSSPHNFVRTPPCCPRSHPTLTSFPPQFFPLLPPHPPSLPPRRQSYVGSTCWPRSILRYQSCSLGITFLTDPQGSYRKKYQKTNQT